MGTIARTAAPARARARAPPAGRYPILALYIWLCTTHKAAARGNAWSHTTWSTPGRRRPPATAVVRAARRHCTVPGFQERDIHPATPFRAKVRRELWGVRPTSNWITGWIMPQRYADLASFRGAITSCLSVQEKLRYLRLSGNSFSAVKAPVENSPMDSQAQLAGGAGPRRAA